MHRFLALVALGAVAAAGLSGCGGTREALGLDKKPAPDEFQVTTRQPLALPPNYQLRPPQPGAQPLETAVTEQAKQTVFGKDPAAAGAKPAPVPVGTRNAVATPVAANAPAVPGFQRRSTGEQALLNKAGAANADPNIRILVDRDSQQIADANKTLVDDLLFWRKPQDPGVIIDAGKESERLKQNAAVGKAPSEGEVPTIKRKSRGIFDGLIN
ncbi:MAG: DUF3035 domain-containing protein [Alphaproteobacteria bacterium]|nr:DUF3035 domain-containing protein [Alphaproteobacteria bacterium]